MVKSDTLSVWHKILLVAGLPAAVTWVGHLPGELISQSTLLLFYLSVVLYVSMKTDQVMVWICTLVCFLGFNYFHILPLYTFQIRAQDEILSILLFILFGILAGTISTRLRSQWQSLQLQKAFLHQQLTLSQALNAQNDINSIPALVRHYLGPLFHNAVSFRLTRTVADQGDSPLQLSWEILPASAVNPAWHTMLLSLREQVQSTLVQHASEQARKLAERQSDEDKLRTALLSSVSHDLKTPLVTMLGAATTLRDLRKDLRTEDADELLDSIITESERLESYIQNLLDMTRLGHGELPLIRAWVSVGEIYHVVEKRLARQHQTSRLDLQVTPGLPALYIHAALVEQGLFNAIDNALKASRPEGKVRISVTVHNSTMAIAVSDQGPGLPHSEWEKVFNPFYTFSLGDCYEKGTGLGLSICRSIFRVHMGDARIIPAPDGFRHCLCLTLPMPDPAATNTETEDDEDSGNR